METILVVDAVATVTLTLAVAETINAVSFKKGRT